jgi:hypothetical protein
MAGGSCADGSPSAGLRRERLAMDHHPTQRTAVDFGELQNFAAHFGKDCGGLWQGKPLYFKGTHCSRLWKLTRGAPVDVANLPTAS